jgi:hypothetical protein
LRKVDVVDKPGFKEARGLTVDRFISTLGIPSLIGVKSPADPLGLIGGDRADSSGWVGMDRGGATGGGSRDRLRAVDCGVDDTLDPSTDRGVEFVITEYSLFAGVL